MCGSVQSVGGTAPFTVNDVLLDLGLMGAVVGEQKAENVMERDGLNKLERLQQILEEDRVEAA